MALVRPFYVKNRKNPNVEGIALTHDILQFVLKDKDGNPTGELGARVEVGVAWTDKDGEEFDPGLCLDPCNPDELIFDGIVPESTFIETEESDEDEENEEEENEQKEE
jgi:hypothetical protein